MASASTSTFLSASPTTRLDDLASLHLRRDHSIPVVLSTQATSASDQGYAEGVVTNTRFGSFPHSTIIGVPWGSQIRASKVDTGSRGRPGKGAKNLKRKAEEALREDDSGAGAGKEVVAAESGFLHVLPPTPENWTTSLPHRTQVVYTPDYSYILHRICARPGSRLIEAGSGSGSFTHAAARAVFNGYPGLSARSEENGIKPQEAKEPAGEDEFTEKEPQNNTDGERTAGDDRFGRVFTYEFHRERHEKVQAEMVQHGLNSIVQAMHRDVYGDGFLVYDADSDSTSTPTPSDQKMSPRATAIFLDLPAPWEALPHLTRDQSQDGDPSALDPNSAVHICTFSPCIEQAQKTVSALRRYDWIDIEMVEIQHKRIDVRREYTGLQYEGIRGTNGIATDVDEALSKLRAVEQRWKEFHSGKPADNDASVGGKSKSGGTHHHQPEQEATTKLPFNEGRLIHRAEPDLKTHTSYLVFAILPRAWTEDDEAQAREKWSKTVKIASNAPKTPRQLKKEAKQRSKVQKRNAINDNNPEAPNTATE